MATRLGIFTVLLLAIACTPPKTTVTRLGINTFPPKPPNCEIQILTQPPANRRFVEIAILSTIATGQAKAPIVSIFSHENDKDLNAMLPNIKATACELGADAVLIKNVEPGLQSNQESYGKAYTVAIKFLD
jgi:hypothetical protein